MKNIDLIDVAMPIVALIFMFGFGYLMLTISEYKHIEKMAKLEINCTNAVQKQEQKE